jgi:hypothetical protein
MRIVSGATYLFYCFEWSCGFKLSGILIREALRVDVGNKSSGHPTNIRAGVHALFSFSWKT